MHHTLLHLLYSRMKQLCLHTRALKQAASAAHPACMQTEGSGKASGIPRANLHRLQCCVQRVCTKSRAKSCQQRGSSICSTGT
jgi:hypothetical protein